MKARFYRGPLDGRVMEVSYLLPAISIRRRAQFSASLHTSDPGFFTIPTVDDLYLQTNHTHPDGSVFYEWSEKRGTRIKR